MLWFYAQLLGMGFGAAPTPATTPTLYVERTVDFTRSVERDVSVSRSVERSVAFDDV